MEILLKSALEARERMRAVRSLSSKGVKPGVMVEQARRAHEREMGNGSIGGRCSKG